MTRKRKVRPDDPLLRGCPTCGALIGQGCREVRGDPTPYASICTRLVHKTRLEGDARVEA